MTSPDPRQVRRAARKAALALEQRDEPMPLTPLERVEQALFEKQQAKMEFRKAIHSAHEQGETIRAIAAAADLSSSRVHQILLGR